MKKKDLQEAAKLTSCAMRKLSKDKSVTADVLVKLYKCLNYTPDDIIEVLSYKE